MQIVKTVKQNACSEVLGQIMVREVLQVELKYYINNGLKKCHSRITQGALNIPRPVCIYNSGFNNKFVLGLNYLKSDVVVGDCFHLYNRNQHYI
jgi:hypothetical protein